MGEDGRGTYSVNSVQCVTSPPPPWQTSDDEAAERALIQAEPGLPLEDTTEREATDAE